MKRENYTLNNINFILFYIFYIYIYIQSLVFIDKTVKTIVV